jgi:hypothetical protein
MKWITFQGGDMSGHVHEAGTRAGYIKSCRRRVKVARDKVLPFVFTAMFGALMGNWFGAQKPDFNWHELETRFLANPFFPMTTTGLVSLAIWTMLIVILWIVSWVVANRYDKKVGTLFVLTALRPGQPQRDYAAGAIGRTFLRVRLLPAVDLDISGSEPPGGFDFRARVEQAAVDFGYALGDDEPETADNLLVNGLWWFGWGLGAQLARAGKPGRPAGYLCASGHANKSQVPGILQWHSPLARGSESEQESHLEIPRIGGHGAWATDVFDLFNFTGVADAIDDRACERAAAMLRCETIACGAGGSGPAILVIELGRQQLIQTEFRPGTHGDTAALLGVSAVAESEFGQCASVLNAQSITWLSRHGADSGYTALHPADFEATAHLVARETSELIRNHRELIVFASMPEALQIAIGARVETLCPESLAKIRFAAFDQSEKVFKIIRMGGAIKAIGGSSPKMLVNLTTHVITILGDDNTSVLVLPAARSSVRLGETISTRNAIALESGERVAVCEVRHSGTEGLPDAEDGVGLVVSRLTALANPSRRDLYFPADEVRGLDGQILGCRRLGRVWVS